MKWNEMKWHEMNEWMNEWMNDNEWMNEWMNKQKWIHEGHSLRHKWMAINVWNEWSDVDCINELVNDCMNHGMNEWLKCDEVMGSR